MIINNPNLEQAKLQIKKAQEKPIVVQGQDDIFNRKILEYGKFDILLSPEAGHRKQKLKQQDSGFNEVMGRIAAKNSVAIGIDFETIRKEDPKELSLHLARLEQNIALCRKTNTKIVCINYHDARNASALLSILGASTKQAKEAIAF